MLCISNICVAQDDWQKVSDSMAMISRVKSDVVLEHFETNKAPKILYSIEDKYFYIIIKDSPCYKEYFVVLNDLNEIKEVRFIKYETNTKKQRRQQKQYKKLLSKAEPIFDFNKYNIDYITKMPNAEYVRGRSSYFVVKDEDGKRYGEYLLPALTTPLPINANLWVYLVRRLSDEMAKKHINKVIYMNQNIQ